MTYGKGAAISVMAERVGALTANQTRVPTLRSPCGGAAARPDTNAGRHISNTNQGD